jgi:hypothetical protein
VTCARQRYETRGEAQRAALAHGRRSKTRDRTTPGPKRGTAPEFCAECRAWHVARRKS